MAWPSRAEQNPYMLRPPAGLTAMPKLSSILMYGDMSQVASVDLARLLFLRQLTKCEVSTKRELMISTHHVLLCIPTPCQTMQYLKKSMRAWAAAHLLCAPVTPSVPYQYEFHHPLFLHAPSSFLAPIATSCSIFFCTFPQIVHRFDGIDRSGKSECLARFPLLRSDDLILMVK